jgi:voltage-dependent calcium channel L type alpha-1D
MMKMIVKARPDLETTNVPKNRFFYFFHWLVTRTVFDGFIMCCIILNMVQMMINFENSSDLYNEVLTNLNYFFTAVFTLEMICKLIGFRHTYFKANWNVFDCVVVCSSWVDIIFTLSTSGTGSGNSRISILRVLPQLARIMRVMRVSRMLRLLNKFKGL